jgi:hypothetical protein
VKAALFELKCFVWLLLKLRMTLPLGSVLDWPDVHHFLRILNIAARGSGQIPKLPTLCDAPLKTVPVCTWKF